ncbi:MAG: hypothetical protein ABIC91_01380 [Nanoarchaeota archaeon]|nr:hypothetical protein [Nanoarchaeota archaeon]MBU1029867.1 hypothetical protein [Nanoarchaeota archaeon]MBU1849283.1 hypothetical protein [Nanoarchaeota archaeon]
MSEDEGSGIGTVTKMVLLMIGAVVLIIVIGIVAKVIIKLIKLNIV